MIGGELLGKLIILSFRDDEEALFSKAISALSSVADFSTVAATADAPLLFGSLQIDPQRRLVWQSAKSMRLSRRTPLTPVGRGSPAWSISSGANWGPGSLRRCGATATVSQSNSKAAPPGFDMGGAVFHRLTNLRNFCTFSTCNPD